MADIRRPCSSPSPMARRLKRSTRSDNAVSTGPVLRPARGVFRSPWIDEDAARVVALRAVIASPSLLPGLARRRSRRLRAFSLAAHYAPLWMMTLGFEAGLEGGGRRRQRAPAKAARALRRAASAAGLGPRGGGRGAGARQQNGPSARAGAEPKPRRGQHAPIGGGPARDWRCRGHAGTPRRCRAGSWADLSRWHV